VPLSLVLVLRVCSVLNLNADLIRILRSVYRSIF